MEGRKAKKETTIPYINLANPYTDTQNVVHRVDLTLWTH